MDNLRYIRRTMGNRAGSFTAVPGIGGMLMGSTAVAAALIADRPTGSGRWLAIWTRRSALSVSDWHRRGGGQIPARQHSTVIGTGAKVRRRVCPCDARRGGIDGCALSGWARAISAGHLAAALRRRCGLRRWSLGTVVPVMGACFMAAGSIALLVCLRLRAMRCSRQAFWRITHRFLGRSLR